MSNLVTRKLNGAVGAVKRYLQICNKFDIALVIKKNNLNLVIVNVVIYKISQLQVSAIIITLKKPTHKLQS